MTDIIVPSSPADLENIKKVMDDLVDSMTRQKAEAEYQSEVYKELEEKYGIKAKYFRRMAKEYFADKFDEKASEEEDYQMLYESVFRINQGES